MSKNLIDFKCSGIVQIQDITYEKCKIIKQRCSEINQWRSGRTLLLRIQLQRTMQPLDRTGRILPITESIGTVIIKAGKFPAFSFLFFCQIFTFGHKILPFHPSLPHGIHLENY